MKPDLKLIGAEAMYLLASSVVACIAAEIKKHNNRNET